MKKNLHTADVILTSNVDGMRRANLTEANLQWSNLSEFNDMRRANLTEVDLGEIVVATESIGEMK